MRIITDDISKYDENWWDNLYREWTHGEVEHEKKHYEVISEMIGEGSVLEVGCGMGWFSKYVKGKYLGIDWSQEAVKKAKIHFPDKDFRVALHTDIKDHYDNACLFEVFEHTDKPKELVEYLKTISNNVYVALPEGEYSKLWVDKDREFMKKFNEATEYHYATYCWEDIKKMFPNAEQITIDPYSIVFKV